MQERTYTIKFPDIYWEEIEEIAQEYNVPVEKYITALLANEVHIVLSGHFCTLEQALSDYKEPRILEFLNTVE